MAIRQLSKYYRLVVAIGFSLAFFFAYYSIFSTNYDRHIAVFETQLHALQSDLSRELDFFTSQLSESKLGELWTDALIHDQFNIHVYRNDSLIFWNTNQLPIIRFAEIHYPSDGLVHLQNGWYFAEMRQSGDFVICGSFLVHKDYSYENKQLVNDFSPLFSFPFESEISTDPETGKAVKDAKGAYIMSLVPSKEQSLSRGQSLVLMITFLGMVLTWMLFHKFIVLNQIT